MAAASISIAEIEAHIREGVPDVHLVEVEDTSGEPVVRGSQSARK